MYETILAATDGSEPAHRAVDHALDLASTFDADLHVIYVVDTRRYGESMLTDSETAVADLEAQAMDLLRDTEARADIAVTTEIRNGRPHDQIDAYAEEIDADLLVIGNRGLGAGSEIGSTAERVVRYVDRPVITA
ncbi:universal stress protein [Natrinema salaciae]|uniref:Nucleotide-binding universal stress protein, UspA family n=1 Tax=Natrinema salaciae TaxID=1186196 RepID=A0A1H9SNW7_9EURY|nr:universal stress protein [Natrinema salaciae]SER86702.1 Nucleotide-binding universal stress protein, UspA family [Natrinema salaciae]